MLLRGVLAQFAHVAEHHDLAVGLQEGEVVQGGGHGGRIGVVGVLNDDIALGAGHLGAVVGRRVGGDGGEAVL